MHPLHHCAGMFATGVGCGIILAEMNVQLGGLCNCIQHQEHTASPAEFSAVLWSALRCEPGSPPEEE